LHLKGLIRSPHTGSGCRWLFFVHDVAIRIGDGDGDAVTAVQAVGGAADSWIIGAHRHLDLVEDAFVVFTVL
jgi:hypothetical protein